MLDSGDRAPLSRSNPTWRFALNRQRSVVGRAHRGGAVRIGTELGAQFSAAYALTLGDPQLRAKESAARLTKPLVHGVATQVPGVAWPTQTRFQNIVSDSWNVLHFPEWANWCPVSDCWAQGTVALEVGVPRIDIAIHHDGFVTTAAGRVIDDRLDATAPDRLADTSALQRAGFTVQFVNPIGLVEPDTVAENGTLYSDGPAYRELIVDERSLLPETAKAIVCAVQHGVRIVIVREAPSADSGFANGEAGDERVRVAIARALAHPSTVRVDHQASAAGAFTRLALVPRAEAGGEPPLVQWSEAGQVRYILAYKPFPDAVTTRSPFEGVGRVRELALTGGRIVVVPHTVLLSRTAVPMGIPARGLRIFELNLFVAPEPATAEPPVEQTVAQLEGWRLDVVSEEPGCLRDIGFDVVGPGDWRPLEDLPIVSDTGRYTARVALPDGRLAGKPAAILLVGAGVARTGGRVVGTAYLDDTVIDLNESLVDGAELKIVISTPLGSAVIGSGISPHIGRQASRAQGLIPS